MGSPNSKCTLCCQGSAASRALWTLTCLWPADQQSSGQKVVLSGRFRAYAEATARLNASHVSGQPFDAVAEFSKACIDEDAGEHLPTRSLMRSSHGVQEFAGSCCSCSHCSIDVFQCCSADKGTMMATFRQLVLMSSYVDAHCDAHMQTAACRCGHAGSCCAASPGRQQRMALGRALPARHPPC